VARNATAQDEINWRRVGSRDVGQARRSLCHWRRRYSGKAWLGTSRDLARRLGIVWEVQIPRSYQQRTWPGRAHRGASKISGSLTTFLEAEGSRENCVVTPLFLVASDLGQPKSLPRSLTDCLRIIPNRAVQNDKGFAGLRETLHGPPVSSVSNSSTRPQRSQ
jgi:hypothetical protein